MSDAPLCKSLEIKNKLGLHARAAALLVQTAARFEADVTVSKDEQVVDGKSILGLLMLEAGPGTSILVSASGPQAAEALGAIEELVTHGFHED
jgi:phosphocarrier protein HPr